MTAHHDRAAAGRRAWLAQANLAELSAVIGRPGWAAVEHNPALLAAVDQHAAAIRDSLDTGARTVDAAALEAAALAAYAAAIRDAAGDSLDDWSHPTWHQLRLLAVCALTRTPTPSC